MRKVMVYSGKYKPNFPTGRIERGEAFFHCWGCDFTEFENGAGNQTIAIVEFPYSGHIEKVDPEWIRFLDRPDIGELFFEKEKEAIK